MSSWQAEVKGQMYASGIRNIDVAEKLGVTRRYMAQIFTGKRTPSDAEQRVRQAVTELIAERSK